MSTCRALLSRSNGFLVVAKKILGILAGVFDESVDEKGFRPLVMWGLSACRLHIYKAVYVHTTASPLSSIERREVHEFW